jgi:hypothetical protein
LLFSSFKCIENSIDGHACPLGEWTCGPVKEPVSKKTTGKKGSLNGTLLKEFVPHAQDGLDLMDNADSKKGQPTCVI